MLSNKLAKYLAIILGPHVWLPVLLFTILFRSNLTSDQLRILLPIIFTLQVGIPITYLLVAPKLGWVSAWDMKNRQERTPFLILLLTLYLASLVVIRIFGNALLLHLNLIFIFLIITTTLINFKWKISQHATLNTAAAILINFLFDWKLPLLYLIIPIVFWARLKLKKHTINQLLAGITTTSLIILGGLRLFGYL